ncbi:MAG: hypothetical protein IPN47_27955 [Gemmatimonadetes bacterium]|nr:hypothetical protein [Gemmatimonadota bacterium]
MANGRLTLKVGTGRSLPEHCQLIPDEYVNPTPIPESVERYVRSWDEGTPASAAVDDLIHRRAPRLRGHGGGRVIAAGSGSDGAIGAARAMDGTTLAIQGPPSRQGRRPGPGSVAALLDGQQSAS